MTLDYVGAHTLGIIRPLDVDAPLPFVRTAQGQTRSAQVANCSRPYWNWWYRQHGASCDSTSRQGTVNSVATPPYSVIQTDVNDGYLHYDALDLTFSHSFARSFQVLASYTWSHTLDNVDPDTTSQNPNDPNFTQHREYGPAIYDQRERLVLSGEYLAPVLLLRMGGVGSFASGLPFNVVTGTNNSGDTGATTDRPVIDGTIIGRNAGRGNGLYSVDPFLERTFSLNREHLHLELRVEVFNLLNHANFTSYSGTYGNGTSPGRGFGAPLPGVTSQLNAREMQFSAQLSF